MERTAHIPGEWNWKQQDEQIVIVGPSGYYHATVLCAAEGDTKAAEEAVATARLIAAAPDMYNELREILEFVTTEGPLREPEIESIRAVLAKAEGR